jgi:hypothetical protein
MAALAYWLAWGLGQSGVEVHLVTDGNLVEPDYRISDYQTEEYLGVTVHYVPDDIPWHIPYSEHRLAKLVDTALAVCRNNSIDIIDAQYLLPYGFAGSIVSSFTGIPYVIRHGGSDISKFLEAGLFPSLINKTLQGAAAVVTGDTRVVAYSRRTVKLPPYVPDEKQFAPYARQSRPITCAYVGKVNYYWEHKGLDKIARIVKSSGIKMIYLAQGKGKADFVQRYNPEGTFQKFLHPSKMPEFLRQIDFLFHFVGENPVPGFSNIVMEAVSMGIPILTDRLDLFEQYKDYFDLDKWVLEVPPSTKEQSFGQFLKGINHPKPVGLKVSYENFIEDNIRLYQEILRCNSM